MANDQWDVNNKSASVTISGANSQIATLNTGGANAAARGLVSGTGNLYFEATISSVFGGGAGFCDSTFLFNDAPGGGNLSGHSVGVHGNNTIFNGFFQGTQDGTGTGGGGDRIALAISQSSKLFWWKDLTTASAWEPSGDPNTLTGGKDISGGAIATATAVYPAMSSFNNGDSVTGFWDNSTITGTIPTGFSLFGAVAAGVPAAIADLGLYPEAL